VIRPALSTLILGLVLAATPVRAGETSRQDFATWLADFRQEATAKGISPATVDAALGDVRPISKVLELDQRQPEFVDTFWNYLDARMGGRQVQLGKDRLWLKRKLLYPIQYRHGVPAALLVALWGMETKYGSFTGGFPVPAALATLAHDSRRAGFFREELLNSLRILQEGHIAAKDMKGSWAGAMGQMQFMPSTFLASAVDADGDGRKDIWRSLPDALDSGAQYLKRLGWQKRRAVGAGGAPAGGLRPRPGHPGQQAAREPVGRPGRHPGGRQAPAQIRSARRHPAAPGPRRARRSWSTAISR
jgi:membrane-bound lytic murein transglycosylase B